MIINCDKQDCRQCRFHHCYLSKEKGMTREEAKEILTHNWTRVDNPNYSESELDEAFFMAIEALQAEPKHGKWIEEKDGWYGGQGCRCSSCEYGYSYKAYHEPYEFDFCPNCGAKMDKGKEE